MFILTGHKKVAYMPCPLCCPGGSQVRVDSAHRPGRQELLLQRRDPGERVGETQGA